MTLIIWSCKVDSIMVNSDLGPTNDVLLYIDLLIVCGL